MFGSGNFWNKSTSWFLKILKLPLFHPGYFKIFKIALGQFIPNRPPKHLITSTYSSVVIILYNAGLWKSAFCTYSIGKLVFRYDQNNTSKVKIKETTLKNIEYIGFSYVFFLNIGFTVVSWFLKLIILANFENFEIALILLGLFQNFQKCTGAICHKSPFKTCDYQYLFVCGHHFGQYGFM